MSFVPYPSTPHVAWLADRPLRGDKLLEPEALKRLLACEVLVEEKVDGANLGLSVVAGELVAQHRGDYLRREAIHRYPHLASWLATRRNRLIDALADRLVLFGEWCSARHSVTYDRLPDWLLIFDVFDREHDAFWDSGRRDQWCAANALATVPELARGSFTINQLISLLGPSRLGPEEMEGLVVRREVDGTALARGKLVRPGHVQPGERHWSGRRIRANRVVGDARPHTGR